MLSPAHVVATCSALLHFLFVELQWAAQTFVAICFGCYRGVVNRCDLTRPSKGLEPFDSHGSGLRLAYEASSWEINSSRDTIVLLLKGFSILPWLSLRLSCVVDFTASEVDSLMHFVMPERVLVMLGASRLGRGSCGLAVDLPCGSSPGETSL